MNEESKVICGDRFACLASGGAWRPIKSGGWGRAATRDRLKWNCAEGGGLPVWEFRWWSGRVRFHLSLGVIQHFFRGQTRSLPTEVTPYGTR